MVYVPEGHEQHEVRTARPEFYYFCVEDILTCRRIARRYLCRRREPTMAATYNSKAEAIVPL
jgi:hypothetical protein